MSDRFAADLYWIGPITTMYLLWAGFDTVTHLFCAFWEHHLRNWIKQLCYSTLFSWRSIQDKVPLENREVQCQASKVVVLHAKFVKRRTRPSHIQTEPLIDLSWQWKRVISVPLLNFYRLCTSLANQNATRALCPIVKRFPPFLTFWMFFILICRLTCVFRLPGRIPDVEKNLWGEDMIFSQCDTATRWVKNTLRLRHF